MEILTQLFCLAFRATERLSKCIVTMPRGVCDMVARWFVRKGAGRLPEEMQAPFIEENYADIDHISGSLAKLFNGFGIIIASIEIKRQMLATTRRSCERDGSTNEDISDFIPPSDIINANGYIGIKRAFDFAVSALLSVFLAPVALLVAFMVAIDVGPSVTLWQKRSGLNGRQFKLYKFCTMGPSQDLRGNRIPDERRISPIGRFLRRTRLDELPQLFNVLTGDMSFVGPRPLRAEELSSENASRLLVRPGLTGWKQINNDYVGASKENSELDELYVRRMSLLLDLKNSY